MTSTSYLPVEKVEVFKKLSPAEKMLRLMDLNSCSSTLFEASLHRRAEKLSAEQFSEVEQVCLSVYDNIAESKEQYELVIQNAKDSFARLLGGEELAPELKAKMN